MRYATTAWMTAYPEWPDSMRPCPERESFISVWAVLQGPASSLDSMAEAIRFFGGDPARHVIYSRYDPCHHGFHIEHIGRVKQ